MSDEVKQLTQKLESLPGEIKHKTSELLDIQISIDVFQDQVATLKLAAMEKVLTDGLATNDKARITAQMNILAKDQLYIDADNSLKAGQKKLRYEQAQLEFLHNQFRAYLAIAGMMGTHEYPECAHSCCECTNFFGESEIIDIIHYHHGDYKERHHEIWMGYPLALADDEDRESWAKADGFENWDQACDWFEKNENSKTQWHEYWADQNLDVIVWDPKPIVERWQK